MVLRTATFYGFVSIVALSTSLAVSADDLIISYPANATLAPPPPVAPATPRPSAPPPPVSVKSNVPAQVSRAQFTTGLSNREPTNNVTQVNAGQTVYYFTELMGLQGHTITHKWQRNGEFQLGLQFPVSAERWRVHSSKTIAPNLTGTWTVSVQNDGGQILRQDTLQVLPAMTSAPTPALVTPSGTPPHNTNIQTTIPSLTDSKPVIPAPSQPLTSIPTEVQKAAEEKKLLSTTNTTATSNSANSSLTSSAAKSEPAKTNSAIDTTAKNHASWDKPSTDSTTKPVWETLNR